VLSSRFILSLYSSIVGISIKTFLIQNDKNMKHLKLILFILLIAFSHTQLQATHIFGADITYQQIGTNTYEVEVSIIRNCFGIGLPFITPISVASVTCGVQTINLNIDTTRTYSISPLCPSEPDRCNTNNGVWGMQQQYYTGTITLPCVANDYVLSWGTCCRNQSGSTFLAGSSYIYVNANLDNTIQNSSPRYHQVPLPTFCINETVHYSRGISDLDGDSLMFSLIDCRTSSTGTVTYFPPYSGINPMATSSGVSIDSQTGNITFRPTIAQASILCVLVEEYRNGQKIGEIVRDFMFSTYNCNTDIPIISGINGSASINGSTGSFDATVCTNQTFTFDVMTYDKNVVDAIINNTPENLKLYMNDAISTATFSVDTTGTYPKGTFQWTPTINDTGLHIVDIIIEDNACPVFARNTFSFKLQVDNSTDLTPYGDTAIFCLNGGPNLLTNYYPTNAIWSHWTGQGITDSLQGIFDPMVAGLGSHDLTFLFYNTSFNVCSSSETFTAKVISGYNVDLGVDQSICAGNNVLTLSNQMPQIGAETWSGNGVNNFGDFSPSISGLGTHPIVLTDSVNNCIIRDTINITVFNGNNTYAGVDTGLCKNDTIQLLGAPNGGFWTGTGLLDSIGLFSLANNTKDTMVTVFYNYMDTSLCWNVDTAMVSVSLGVVDAGNDFSMCLGDSLAVTQLMPSPLGGIWQGANIDSLTGILDFTNMIPGSQSAIYTYTNTTGCTVSDTLQMTFVASPTVEAGTTDTLLTSNNSLTLSGYSPLGGFWTGQGIIDSIAGIFNPTLIGQGNYLLTYNFDNGTCITTDTKTVHVDFGLNTAKVNINYPIKVFPNPFTNVLTIHFEKMPSDVTQIKLMNSIGEVIAIQKTAPTFDYIFKIDQTIPSGIYFLEIMIKDKKSVFQVIKL
jgi:hypothetical protein